MGGYLSELTIFLCVSYSFSAGTTYNNALDTNTMCINASKIANECYALFLMFSAYYVFNLDYHKQRRMYSFFQDYILGYPDSFKRPSPYITVVSDNKRNM